MPCHIPRWHLTLINRMLSAVVHWRAWANSEAVANHAARRDTRELDNRLLHAALGGWRQLAWEAAVWEAQEEEVAGHSRDRDKRALRLALSVWQLWWLGEVDRGILWQQAWESVLRRAVARWRREAEAQRRAEDDERYGKEVYTAGVTPRPPHLTPPSRKHTWHASILRGLRRCAPESLHCSLNRPTLNPPPTLTQTPTPIPTLTLTPHEALALGGTQVLAALA
jgi:hypothetical protein